MKKRKTGGILAVGALMMAGGVQAEGSLSISGFVNAGIRHLNDGTTPLGAYGKRGQTGVLTDDSALAFKGSEDLGGGWGTRFWLESRFYLSDGSPRTAATAMTPPPSFFFQSTVGLTSPYGSIDVGRQPTATGLATLFMDPTTWTGAGQIGMLSVPNGFVGNDVISQNQAIAYASPTFNGWSAGASYAFRNSVTALAESVGAEKGFNLQYVSDKMRAMYGYDRSRIGQLHVASFRYDLGLIEPVLGAAVSKRNGVSSSMYSIGANIPLGNRFVLRLVRAQGHLDDRTGVHARGLKSVKYGGMLDYNLSKRTRLYASAGSANAETMTRTTAVDVGIFHAF